MTIDSAAPVIVGVDGSPAGYRSAVWAAREAQIRGRQLLLLAVNTWPSYIGTPWGGNEWDVEAGRAVCTDVLEQARRGAQDLVANLTIRTEVVEGLPARVLIERSAGASLTVIGRRGGGEFSSLLLGSSAAQIATHAEGPVVVVPEVLLAPTPGGPGIVVGVDDGDHSQEAVAFAFDEASRRRLPLTAVRAWTLQSEEPAIRTFAPDPEALESEQRRMLSEALAGWCAKFPDVAVRHWVVRHHAGRVLVEVSRSASLLVVGARGSGGFPELRLGSIGDAAIRHAHCPVAVIR
jgi:nucleotide-binding universal stress UspA family protein